MFNTLPGVLDGVTLVLSLHGGESTGILALPHTGGSLASYLRHPTLRSKGVTKKRYVDGAGNFMRKQHVPKRGVVIYILPSRV